MKFQEYNFRTNENEITGENEIEISAACFRENENEIPNPKMKLK